MVEFRSASSKIRGRRNKERKKERKKEEEEEEEEESVVKHKSADRYVGRPKYNVKLVLKN